MNDYVITGGTSFLGCGIIKNLIKQGKHVYAIIRPTSKSVDMFRGVPGVTIVLSDMDDVDLWKRTIASADCFLHLGWDGVGAEGRKNPEIQNKNVQDAIKCMNGAYELGCKVFLFAGSQAEYGPKNCVIDETAECEPVINYGIAKLQVCKELTSLSQKLGMKYYHTRIFSVYGPGDHPWTLVSSCIEKLLNNETMKLSSCEQFWNFLYIDDAAEQICRLLNSKSESGIYNIASEDTRPLKSFVKDIYQLCGNKGVLDFASYNPLEKPVDLRPDINKLKKVIGKMDYISFSDGIKEVIKVIKK